MTEKKSPVISFKDFSFQYRAQKKPTLTRINLDIYPGEKVLIAGPSGSGKSTLAGCINGLNPFSNPGECKGTLTVDGVDAPHSSIFELSAHVGTVLQDPDGQFIGLTVGEDIAFALENSCTPQDEMHAITRHAAELVGIENHLDYAPHELSGGQKQRVSLAGVMVDQVKILLFDEPLANLDPATGKQAIELIDEIQKKTDTTVLIIEHRLEDVLWRNVDLGLIEKPLRILYSYPAIVIGMTYVLLPFMILSVYSSAEKLDWSLVEAARDLGASPMKAFWTVSFKLTLPGLLSGVILTFIPSMGLFFIADILGGNKIVLVGSLIQEQMTKGNNWPFAAALAVVLMVLTTLMIMLYRKITNAKELEGVG